MSCAAYSPSYAMLRRPGAWVLAAVALWGGLAANPAPAEDAAPIDFTVFYSPQDPNWPATDAALQAEMAKFPRLRRRLVSTGDDAGKAELEKTRAQLDLTVQGECVLAMGPFALVNRGAQKEIETYFEPMLLRVLNPDAGKGKVEAPLREFARKHFGAGVEAERLPGEPVPDVDLFAVKAEGRLRGYVVQVFRSIRCPLCSDAQLLLAVEPERLTITALQPVRSLERYGKALDAVETTLFCRRYVGQGPGKKTYLLDAITGATKTKRMYDQAVEEALRVLEARVRAQPAPQAPLAPSPLPNPRQ